MLKGLKVLGRLIEEKPLTFVVTLSIVGVTLLIALDDSPIKPSLTTIKKHIAKDSVCRTIERLYEFDYEGRDVYSYTCVNGDTGRVNLEDISGEEVERIYLLEYERLNKKAD